MLKVTLISHTPNPQKTIAAAAKLCYSASEIETLYENLDDEKADSFVNMLSQMGHESPFEHISFTFGIEGVSRPFMAQITRHRIASYSVQSQRYVNKSQFEFVIPPEIDGIEEAKDEFIKSMEEAQIRYNRLTDILKEKHLKGFLEEGFDQKTAENMALKQANEDARFVLPNACDTRMIVTMNARSLFNFFEHRLCNRAQWEIREVALLMYKLVLEAAPSIFEKTGPRCLFGPCPEGKMSCKKMVLVRETYTKIKESIK